MTPLTFDQIQLALLKKYGDDAHRAPAYFSKLIPVPAASYQVTETQAVIRQLTGYGCPPAFHELLARWDFTNLNVAGFSFGFKDSFAEKLLSNNRPDAVNGWWDEAFEERPKTLLFIAQGDPYVILLDVQTGAVLAYQAGNGATTAVKIAGDLSICIRTLSTIQLYQPTPSLGGLNETEIQGVLGNDCDEQFWAEQIRHWAEFN